MALADADRQHTAAGHRVARVDGEVEQCVLELVRIDHGVETGGRQPGLDFDRLGQRAHQQLRHILHQRADLDGSRLQRLAPRKGQQTLDQFGAATGGVERRSDVLAGALGVGRQLFLQAAEIADDDRQQVVEVVGEAAGQLSDGLHLLGLDQCRLTGLLLGDVDRQHEGPEHPAVAADLRHDHAARIDAAALLGIPRVFVGHRFAGIGAIEVAVDLAVGLGAEYLLDAAADDVAGGQSEPFGVAAVGELVALIGVDVGDQGGDRIHDQAQAGLASPQGAGDLVDFGIGPGEPAVGFLEFAGAGLDPQFEFGILPLDQCLVAPLLGDVGP